MSRAMNVDLTQPDVLAACIEQGASVSASERLPAGGTRVVFTSTDGADLMRGVFAGKLLMGAVPRTPFAAKWSS